MQAQTAIHVPAYPQVNRQAQVHVQLVGEKKSPASSGPEVQAQKQGLAQSLMQGQAPETSP
jgi:hypothetical protein